MIQALSAVPDADLVIAGGPPQAELDNDPEARRLRQLATDLKVTDRVKFLGRVAHTQIPALLRSADIFVCTPWYEPFGMAALEAAACGLPVVATAVGGLRETVVDGTTGSLVPPARPVPLSTRLTELLADPARRASYGAAGAKRAARYSWTQVTQEILDVYCGLSS